MCENIVMAMEELEEISDQFVAAINSLFFSDAENRYEEEAIDYVGFTPENIQSMYLRIKMIFRMRALDELAHNEEPQNAEFEMEM